MAPTGSRTPIWPFVLISVVAALFLLLVAFNSQLISALKDLEFRTQAPLHPPAGGQSTYLSQSHHELPYKTTLFRERPILEDLSPAADAAWEKTLLTRKGGFLWVEFNETSNEAWGIAMFHALHCLKMLRIVTRSSPIMKSVVAVGSEGSDKSERRRATIEHPDMDPAHIGHCIGYIAQHLMCAADSTIEPPWANFDDDGQIVDAGVNGEGYQHQCRDASLLWETAAESEKTAIKPWQWRLGDTVESIFGPSKG